VKADSSPLATSDIRFCSVTMEQNGSNDSIRLFSSPRGVAAHVVSPFANQRTLRNQEITLFYRVKG
jgi:hypothetical protein